MLELAPGDLKGDASFPIRVVAKYPITISWSMKGQNGDGYMLAYQSGKKDEKVRALRANGSMQLQQPAEGLRLRISSVGSQLPIEFALGQNYPNPFNPTTEIQYALPVDARVSLKVYNITGQEVATLLDDVQEAGYHERLWNSRNFSNVQLGSGVYFYRLIATGVSDSKALFDQVRKMILMK